MVTIGARIRLARQQKGMTQKQVADACGMADSAIRKYESGTQTPKLETLQRIAKALHVNWTDLCSDDQQANIVTDYYVNLKRPPMERISHAFEYLSPKGQEVAADLVEIVAGNPFYCVQQPPQSPPEGE